MTLRQLKAFLAVAQTLSFAEASKKIFISQPALSLAIKNLEDRLGGRLIVRTTRTVSLTPEGKALYEKGRRLVNEWDTLEEEMRQRFELERGQVSIAAMPSFAANVLPEVIKSFRQKYPEVNVQIHDVVAEETIELVRSGGVELGVAFLPAKVSNPDEFTHLCTDQFVAVLPENHSLSARKSIAWKEILSDDFIALQRPSMVRSLIEEELNDAGISLYVTYDSHQFATVGRMVSNGLGVSVVPTLCSDQMRETGACVVPLTEPSITSEIGIFTKRKDQLSVPAHALFDALKGYYKGLD